VLDVAVYGRARRHGRRNNRNHKAHARHRQRRASATHKSLILGQPPQETGVRNPPLLARALTRSTCTPPSEGGRRDHHQQDDGN